MLDVEAADKYDAQKIAKCRAWGSLLNEQPEPHEDAPPYALTAEQYEEPTNWSTEAESLGKDVAGDLENEIAEAVRTYKDSKEGDKGDEEAEAVEYDEDDVNEIYDELYQSEDLSDRAWEMADGYFIYNSTAALIKAMECIDELSDYASGDSGLWEGVEEYERIIQIQATDALRGGVMNEIEEAVKAKIADLLGVEV